MNKILYIVMAVFLFSCKSSTVAQENKTETAQKPKVKKPKFSDIQNNAIGPNTILLTTVIQDIIKDVEICNKKYKVTTIVKVKRITNSGSSIVNMLSSGQEITLCFMNSQIKDFDSLKRDIIKGQEVFFKVRENLCPDMSKTMYEIIRFEINY